MNRESVKVGVSPHTSLWNLYSHPKLTVSALQEDLAVAGSIAGAQ